MGGVKWRPDPCTLTMQMPCRQKAQVRCHNLCIMRKLQSECREEALGVKHLNECILKDATHHADFAWQWCILCMHTLHPCTFFWIGEWVSVVRSRSLYPWLWGIPGWASLFCTLNWVLLHCTPGWISLARYPTFVSLARYYPMTGYHWSVILARYYPMTGYHWSVTLARYSLLGTPAFVLLVGCSFGIHDSDINFTIDRLIRAPQ